MVFGLTSLAVAGYERFAVASNMQEFPKIEAVLQKTPDQCEKLLIFDTFDRVPLGALPCVSKIALLAFARAKGDASATAPLRSGRSLTIHQGTARLPIHFQATPFKQTRRSLKAGLQQMPPKGGTTNKYRLKAGLH